MYPKLWQASGLTYGQLLDELISLAQSATHVNVETLNADEFDPSGSGRRNVDDLSSLN